MDSVNPSTAMGSPSAESASISLEKKYYPMDYPRRFSIRVCNLEKLEKPDKYKGSSGGIRH